MEQQPWGKGWAVFRHTEGKMIQVSSVVNRDEACRLIALDGPEAAFLENLGVHRKHLYIRPVQKKPGTP
jgi:hypothetical protein